ncbi:MAG TPA: S-layer homology domain-containing protein, partial [Acidimicrobiia bacterium]|nr:S-layer homology domain-containing protein [Acidimicrobiia bacterium]
GTTPSTFSPNVVVPRWQMALFLVRQARVHGVAVPPPVDHGFTDIDAFDQATRDAINQLASLGITTGTSPTTFSPNDQVSRWQMAIFLVRLSIRVGIPVPTVPPDAGFVDISGLDEPTQTAINQLAAINITKGTSATDFSPDLAVTRWQMAIFLTRVLQVDGVVPT